jgi:hypothetical protein
MTAFQNRSATRRSSVRLNVEQFEDRCLLSGTGVAPAWFTSNLQDADIRSLASMDYQHDGSLTRKDVIAIFKEAAEDGRVTTIELTDLRTLVVNGTALGMTDAVENLAYKTVNYNPANTTFQGDPLAPAGTLLSGNTGGVLNKLVEKWFLGEDLPSLATTGATGYKLVKGSLFGPGGPQATDVMQGNLADCYFMAPLASTALESPQTIQSMFTDNADGTWTVRFYNNGQADYVTVNAKLPVANGIVVGADYGDRVNNPGNVLWVSLAEKAYAQVAEEGWSRAYDRDYVKAWNKNSYAALNYGWACDSLQQINGTPGNITWIAGATQQQLINAIDAHEKIALGSDDPASGTLPDGVLANHYYAVTGYHTNAANQVVFDVLNPYADGTGARTLSLTWQQLQGDFADWEYVA